MIQTLIRLGEQNWVIWLKTSIFFKPFPIYLKSKQQPLKVGEGNSIVNRQLKCLYEEREGEKVQKHQYANLTLPRWLKPLVKDLLLFCQDYADHERTSSSYYWVRRTKLAGEDGRPACKLHVPTIKAYEYTTFQGHICR